MAGKGAAAVVVVTGRDQDSIWDVICVGKDEIVSHRYTVTYKGGGTSPLKPVSIRGSEKINGLGELINCCKLSSETINCTENDCTCECPNGMNEAVMMMKNVIHTQTQGLFFAAFLRELRMSRVYRLSVLKQWTKLCQRRCARISDGNVKGISNGGSNDSNSSSSSSSGSSSSSSSDMTMNCNDDVKTVSVRVKVRDDSPAIKTSNNNISKSCGNITESNSSDNTTSNKTDKNITAKSNSNGSTSNTINGNRLETDSNDNVTSNKNNDDTKSNSNKTNEDVTKSKSNDNITSNKSNTNTEESNKTDQNITKSKTNDNTSINKTKNTTKSNNNSHITSITVWVEIQDTLPHVLDYSWSERMCRCSQERQHLDTVMSWLSTLGGACSALGDQLEGFAEKAWAISLQQLDIAKRLGDPTIESRCRLYAAIALIQQCHFKVAARTIKQEYRWAHTFPAEVRDIRLVRMCHGIWTKLRHERNLHRLTHTTTTTAKAHHQATSRHSPSH